MKTLQALLPAAQAVILLGDGEFDGSELVTWFEKPPIGVMSIERPTGS